jgi:hypothetical protein
LLDAPVGVLAYERTLGEDSRVVLVNFTGEPQDVEARGTVEVSSTGNGEGKAFAGALGPNEAVLLS